MHTNEHTNYSINSKEITIFIILLFKYTSFNQYGNKMKREQKCQRTWHFLKYGLKITFYNRRI